VSPIDNIGKGAPKIQDVHGEITAPKGTQGEIFGFDVSVNKPHAVHRLHP